MKKILTTLLIILLLPLYSLPIFAQEEVVDNAEVVTEEQEILTSGYFDIEIEIGTQSPWSMDVPLTVRFRSSIDSDKTEISWDAPAGINVKKKHKEFVAVKKDEIYSYTAMISPEQAGSYEIAANVTAWLYNTNYTSSSTTQLTFDEDLVTVPQTTGYGSAVMFKSLSLVLIFVILVTGGVFGFKLGVEKLKSWLKPPDF